MTGEKIRDIGYLAWENDLAWLEYMKGNRWKSLLRREKHYWNTLTNNTSVQQTYEKFLKLFRDDVEPRLGCGTTIVNGVIRVYFLRGEGLAWHWLWSNKMHYSIGLQTDGTHVWYTRNIRNEHYKYELICEAMDGTVLWKKQDISVEVCVKNGLCYFIRLEYPFDTTGLYVCNAYTGKHEEHIFREYDGERFIELIQCANNTLVCKSGTWQESRSWIIHGKTLTRVYKDSRFQYILDEKNAILIDKDTLEQKYVGEKLNSLKLPSLKDYTIQWVNINTGHVITTQNGEKTLWYCQPKQSSIVLYSTLGGDISASAWSYWYNEPVQEFHIRTFENPPWILRAVDDKALPNAMCRSPSLPLPFLEAHRYTTTSEDGTKVSYLVVHTENTKPTKLLCYVYGAYGSSTVVMWPYMHWAPLLLNGWAVVFSYPRGSGDRDVQWMRNGQAENHIKTIQDFEAVIRDAQYKYSISAQKTAIYGRSAGGLMVGGTTARNPDGHLMGATFTEVPFVDAIRSQTNPDIPLVESGYSEYGNPLKSIRDFKALLNISPINSLSSDGAPGVFVLCRTGLKDLQVLPFEPVKWIQRLRGKSDPPAGKYLSFEEDQAHVYSGEKYYKARAIDLALLDLWADGKLSVPGLSPRVKKISRRSIKMAQQQKQQGGRRRKTHRRKSHRRRTHRRSQRK
jgi:pimeloyl-ACP methyl ester carboxylesterase